MHFLFQLHLRTSFQLFDIGISIGIITSCAVISTNAEVIFLCIHSGPENLKKSRQKTREIK